MFIHILLQVSVGYIPEQRFYVTIIEIKGSDIVRRMVHLGLLIGIGQETLQVLVAYLPKFGSNFLRSAATTSGYV